jgi:16S rRNA (guanine527-N7)-methyltransferase
MVCRRLQHYYFPQITTLVRRSTRSFWKGAAKISNLHSLASSTMHLPMTRELANPISPERIRQLLAPFVEPMALKDSQVSAILVYIDLLLKWNAKLNLTAIRDPEEIITRHFGESLFAARRLFPTANSHESVIDIGSGAGFPGFPIKVWCPCLELTLIESNQRKATFLREVIRALDLKSSVVLAERAESVSLRADIVTFRAVERFEHILPVALSLVKPGGRIALLIGEMQVRRAESTIPIVTWSAPIPIPLTRNGRLLIGQART